MRNTIALELPDALLVIYYRNGEIDDVQKVEKDRGKLRVTVKIGGTNRLDRWQDLGGGLGYVPAAE